LLDLRQKQARNSSRQYFRRGFPIFLKRKPSDGHQNQSEDEVVDMDFFMRYVQSEVKQISEESRCGV